MTPAFFSRLVRLLPLVMILGFGAGCGDGSTRISGKATFGGKPIPSGKIYFIPDGAKGNKGATGYADIVDGVYDTSAGSGRGATRGAVVVAIEGNDPAATNKPAKGDTSGETTVKSLFPRYETALDVTGTMTKDFDVPAEAAKAKVEKGPAIIIP
ncbi:hypothetical protein [Limnoglobus roseus]|uniref:Uncharacterized protein n=1 Tax=Limnoglobus roseus TaxID=2598579 RepID=A0A5C1AD79_9BACT|nr:hypothetical protein [Limnoglobus roseus]QEL15722.1 hypothetical protein PX52LOC_02657 [Limnoglobus roseus]